MEKLPMNSSLTDAAFNGNVDDVVRLLDVGEDINAIDGVWNPLHAAIENEHSDCVGLLLGRGADIERSCGKLTPLAHAVDIAIDGTIQSGGKPGDEPIEIIIQLLAAGAAPAPGLKLAREYECDKIVKLLMNAIDSFR